MTHGRGTTLGLGLGFALGLAFTAAALFVALRPALAWGLWCRVRHGGEPGASGIALVVEPAPTGTAGPGPGPWLVVWHVNTGRAPALVCWSDPPGDELAFEVVPEGASAPLPPARGPEAVTVAGAPPRGTWVPPGGRVGVRGDLSRWVSLPGPGAYTVRAARAPLGDPRGGVDGVRCTSEPVRVQVP